MVVEHIPSIVQWAGREDILTLIFFSLFETWAVLYVTLESYLNNRNTQIYMDTMHPDHCYDNVYILTIVHNSLLFTEMTQEIYFIIHS